MWPTPTPAHRHCRWPATDVVTSTIFFFFYYSSVHSSHRFFKVWNKTQRPIDSILYAHPSSITPRNAGTQVVSVTSICELFTMHFLVHHNSQLLFFFFPRSEKRLPSGSTAYSSSRRHKLSSNVLTGSVRAGDEEEQVLSVKKNIYIPGDYWKRCAHIDLSAPCARENVACAL